jgi:hypothetical protein
MKSKTEEEIMTRKLTKSAQILREEWKDLPKCKTPVSVPWCYCFSCTHKGNPKIQEKENGCWEDENQVQQAPRQRVRDW